MLFLEAIRVKYRLSEDGYRRYYTNTLRVKLSRFLYDQGTRKTKQKSNEQDRQSSEQQQTTTTVASNTNTHAHATVSRDPHHSNTNLK